MSKQARLVLYDGNAIFHRAYHAIASLSTKDGQPTNAVYGFSVMLLKSLQELKPEYAIIAWDKSKKTFRNDLLETYKANRAATPVDLREQIPLVKEVAKVLDIPLIETEGFEADDIIGTLATQASQQNLDTVIVTGDKDELQLIDHNVKVYTMRKGFSDTLIYDEAKMREVYGLTPKQFIDYKALKGDPSDNIVGVAGVGDKTASKLLVDFGSLEGIYEHLEDLKPAIKEKIATAKDAVFLNRRLATIVTDMDIRLDLERARWGEVDRPAAVELFKRLEFRSLLERLPQASSQQDLFGDEAAPSTHGIDTKYTQVDTPSKVKELVKTMSAKKALAIRILADGQDPVGAQITGLAVCWKPEESYYIPLNTAQSRRELINILSPVLENDAVAKIGHDLKRDYILLKQHGIKLAPIKFDVMVAAFLLNPLRRSPDISDLAFNQLGIEVPPSPTASGELVAHSCIEVDIIWRLYEKLSDELARTGSLAELAESMEWPLIPVLAEAQIRGIALDSKILEELAEKVDSRLLKNQKDIWELAGGEFNIASTQQLKEVLFDRLHLEAAGLKRGKSGISTAASELDKLQGTHPIIDLVREFRELSKLKSTYIDALPRLVDGNNRLHTSLNQTIAQTGRLSSTSPNLQNIPVRTELGRQIRLAFSATSGKILLSADYSQMELRLAAVLSGDKGMIKAFNSGQDFHIQTAAELYGVEPGEVTKQMRSAAKTINFGVLYGMSPHGLSIATGMDRDQAKAFIDRYFGLRSTLLEYIEGLKHFAKTKGYVETIFGRRRPTPDVLSSNAMVRQAAERAAVNMPIQGAAADIMKLAMIAVDRRFPGMILLQVHDELLLEVPIAQTKEVSAEVKSLMEGVHRFEVDIEVSVRQGATWGGLDSA